MGNSQRFNMSFRAFFATTIIILLSSNRTLLPTQAQFFRGYSSPETLKTKKSTLSDYDSNNNLVSSSVSLSTCGNLICDIEQGETTDNCAMDCQCNLNDKCDDWESSNSCPLDCHCGNLICDRELGENSDNCPSDCTKGCNEMEENEVEMDGDGITMEDMDMNMDNNMNNDGSKMAVDEGDDKEDTACEDNGISCSNNSDCCSFACDSVCVG